MSDANSWGGVSVRALGYDLVQDTCEDGAYPMLGQGRQ